MVATLQNVDVYLRVGDPVMLNLQAVDQREGTIGVETVIIGLLMIVGMCRVIRNNVD